MANPSPPVRRVSARVILVDEDDRVLLFFNRDSPVSGAGYYFTVGGGVDEGESLAEAAARELFEETGLRVAPEALGPVVCRREGPWTTNAGLRLHAEESYFFLRTARFDPDLDGLDAGERNEILRAEWLSPADLDATDATVFPVGLAGLLKRLLAGERPEDPIDLPWIDLTED
ncbi:NUDIX hydrolase [Glycomyces sp. NPDC048151]|uniref:NUDIX hydrolase n=1 Tax=Glycomyces sp. NPDC048151 TaxID=3364002 RepID=UPI00371ADB31